MLSCMGDSAHDAAHVYRVLFNALEIAQSEGPVDGDVLIGACLLHDIGRGEQRATPSLCHAQVGAEKAYRFLRENRFDEAYARAVGHCIAAHRFRGNTPPQSLEAKILFDADKLDSTGAIGMARTLLYKGAVGDPLYRVDEEGRVSDGTGDLQPSFFQEYKTKLEKRYTGFYTERGAAMARSRRQAAAAFYENLLGETAETYRGGRQRLRSILERPDATRKEGGAETVQNGEDAACGRKCRDCKGGNFAL